MLFYLFQYNFFVQYVPGSGNVEADCLSRNPFYDLFDTEENLKIVNFIKLKEIIEDQKKINNDISSYINVKKKGDIIYIEGKEFNRIIISPEFRRNIVEKIYNKFGHIGPKQIQLKITPFYYCKNMKSIINDFCHACD